MEQTLIVKTKVKINVPTSLDTIPEDVASVIVQHVRNWVDLSGTVGETERKRR